MEMMPRFNDETLGGERGMSCKLHGGLEAEACKETSL